MSCQPPSSLAHPPSALSPPAFRLLPPRIPPFACPHSAHRLSFPALTWAYTPTGRSIPINALSIRYWASRCPLIPDIDPPQLHVKVSTPGWLVIPFGRNNYYSHSLPPWPLGSCSFLVMFVSFSTTGASCFSRTRSMAASI